MKVRVEFGKRGPGGCTQVVELPTAKLASELAAKIAYVFGRLTVDPPLFLVERSTPRRSWVGLDYHVSVEYIGKLKSYDSVTSFHKGETS